MMREADVMAEGSVDGGGEAYPFARTEMLLGRPAMEKLKNSHVAIFGVGGVGGYVCETLVRSGVGSFDLIDKDRVDVTNLNRQIIATRETIGRLKVEVCRERMLSVNPDVRIRIHPCFFLPETAAEFDFSEYDYVVDAVDTVAAKIELVLRARGAGVPIICACGAGNKLDPSRFRVADLSKTRVCPLARVLRRELGRRGVEHLKVVYSEEPPIQTGGRLPGSIAFVPAAAGLVLAGEVVRDLAGETQKA